MDIVINMMSLSNLKQTIYLANLCLMANAEVHRFQINFPTCNFNVYNILTHTSNAKCFRCILLIKNEVLQKLLYRSEVMADIQSIRL